MAGANRPKDLKNEEHSFNINRRTKSNDKRSSSQRDEDKAAEADRGATRKR